MHKEIIEKIDSSIYFIEILSKENYITYVFYINAWTCTEDINKIKTEYRSNFKQKNIYSNNYVKMLERSYNCFAKK